MKLKNDMQKLVTFLDADSGMAVLRGRTHATFDRLWKEKYMTRARAYRWLAKKMGLTKDEAHIALFNAKQCYQVIALAEVRLGERLSLEEVFDNWEDFHGET